MISLSSFSFLAGRESSLSALDSTSLFMLGPGGNFGDEDVSTAVEAAAAVAVVLLFVLACFESLFLCSSSISECSDSDATVSFVGGLVIVTSASVSASVAATATAATSRDSLDSVCVVSSLLSRLL